MTKIMGENGLRTSKRVQADEEDASHEQDSVRPLPRDVAVLKWGQFFDSRIGGAGATIEKQMAGLVKMGATEASLRLFWQETKHLSWPGSWGQSPWETASSLGAALEAQDLGPRFKAVGHQYIEPFRNAILEQSSAVPTSEHIRETCAGEAEAEPKAALRPMRM